jgi:hypothetical protein
MLCMRARLASAVLLGVCALAAAEPKTTPVDIKPVRDELQVFVDSQSYVYLYKPWKAPTDKAPEQPARLFFGKSGSPLYEQVIVGRSTNGPKWSIQTWAPRITNIRPAYFQIDDHGAVHKICDQDDVVLTQLTGDKAKQQLDKAKPMTEFLMRRPHLLGRDDTGVYYYVDHYAQLYGGKGYRVFVGKKGAMKPMPLSDVATDVAGEVFATKTGDLRLTRNAGTEKIVWARGEKKTELVRLDVDANSALIFSELGVYQFLGTLCDNI